MQNNQDIKLKNFINEPYKYGFIIPIEKENLEKGLNEETIKLISKKKNEPDFMLSFRMKAFKKWQKMSEPEWAFINYTKPNYQDIRYYSAPQKKKSS